MAEKLLDKAQQRVIDANEEYNLVLAPPGCGKTEILTHRIIKAHEQGVPFSDMLCLTFTNRASRGMMERIRKNISDPSVSDIFVGNVHRFCSKFLFDNKIVPADTSIIDEIDAEDILNECGMGKIGADDSNLTALKTAILATSHRLYQYELNQPERLYLYSEEKAQYKKGTEEDEEKSREVARTYLSYKKEHNLMDFDDILIDAYQALCSPTYRADYSGVDFKWIQVDEVQDLNPLQFAIIEKITSDEKKTVMYLGDEQQAIFSFMGAKLSSLDVLKEKAHGNVLRLEKNYRSPKYLLDIFNTYAAKELNISKEFLPETDNMMEHDRNDLAIIESELDYREAANVANLVDYTIREHPGERVAVVVRTNKQADNVCLKLADRKIPHFRLSGKDVFKTETYKAVIAHLNVIAKDNSFMDWARLLYACKATRSFTDARFLVKKLRDAAMTPGDFLEYGESSYVKEFCKSYKDKEIVIFDTETTGLDVYENDIIQIAAIKVKNGRIVPGSEYDVILHTDQEIPEMLGKKVNPMVAVYNEREKLPREKALEDFLDYIGDDEVLGHNSTYDLEILSNNVKRSCPHRDVHGQIKVCWDSLKLIRLLRPYFRVYKLEALLEVLGLEGINSHKANDDILATKSLVDYCYGEAAAKIQAQDELMAVNQYRESARKFVENYKDIYAHTVARLDERDVDENFPVLAEELSYVYYYMLERGFICAQERMAYVLEFIRRHVASSKKASYLRTQLQSHCMELSTFNESDLCDDDIVKEKVYVMTVYKAKGLEFETVIVYGASTGMYPDFRSVTNEAVKEDKRVFYVALSRAKKRLYVSYYKRACGYPKRLTPFMRTILGYFM